MKAVQPPCKIRVFDGIKSIYGVMEINIKLWTVKELCNAEAEVYHRRLCACYSLQKKNFNVLEFCI